MPYYVNIAHFFFSFFFFLSTLFDQCLLQWNLNENTITCIQEIEYVIRKMSAILFRPQCVKYFLFHHHWRHVVSSSVMFWRECERDIILFLMPSSFFDGFVQHRCLHFFNKYGVWQWQADTSPYLRHFFFQDDTFNFILHVSEAYKLYKL